MKRTGMAVILAIATFACVVANPVFADVLSTGVDTNALPMAASSSPAIHPTCSVLFFGTPSSNENTRLASLGYTITQTTNVAALTAANLANYKVLIIAYVGPGVIGAAQPAIQAYVQAGHGLLIHQPDHVGAIDYAPTGFDVSISSQYWCNNSTSEQAVIVDGSHPVTTGLTNTDLSGDFETVSLIGGGYTLLAQNATCLTPSLAAGTLGGGRIVFDTGNASLAAIDPGSDLYWQHILNWLCEAQNIVQVALDIKPTSCPNPYNVKALGKLPVAILGSANFDVTDINTSTIKLDGVSPLRWSIEDVAAPAPDGGNDGSACLCSSAGPDGYPDLTLKFSRTDLTAALGDVTPGQVIELTIQGTLNDGTPFTGTDCIVIRPAETDLTPVSGADVDDGLSGRGAPIIRPAGQGNTVQTTWGAIKSRHE